jgi:hypothetical protein
MESNLILQSFKQNKIVSTLFEVNLVCVESETFLRMDCYKDLAKLAYKHHATRFTSIDMPEITQLDMTFWFASSDCAFKFMEAAIKERPDAAIGYVQIVEKQKVQL